MYNMHVYANRVTTLKCLMTSHFKSEDVLKAPQDQTTCCEENQIA